MKILTHMCAFVSHTFGAVVRGKLLIACAATMYAAQAASRVSLDFFHWVIRAHFQKF